MEKFLISTVTIAMQDALAWILHNILTGYCLIFGSAFFTQASISRWIFVIACWNTLFCRWYYDSSEGVCHELSYGGKKGNGNRFLTRQDCEASCQPSQVRYSSFQRNTFRILQGALGFVNSPLAGRGRRESRNLGPTF